MQGLEHHNLGSSLNISKSIKKEETEELPARNEAEE